MSQILNGGIDSTVLAHRLSETTEASKIDLPRLLLGILVVLIIGMAFFGN
jgi:hypothetical protein